MLLRAGEVSVHFQPAHDPAAPFHEAALVEDAPPEGGVAREAGRVYPEDVIGPLLLHPGPFMAAVVLVLVAFVHFLSGEEREAPIRDVYAFYDSPLLGLLALVVLYGLVLSLAALFVTALRAVLALRTRV